jgi:hypothetical protein
MDSQAPSDETAASPSIREERETESRYKDKHYLVSFSLSMFVHKSACREQAVDF